MGKRSRRAAESTRGPEVQASTDPTSSSFPFKRTLISNAILLAGAGLHATSAVAESCTVASGSTRTAVCVMVNGDATTVNTNGSIAVTSGSAIDVTLDTTSTLGASITNDGTISTDDGIAIVAGGTGGDLSIVNNLDGEISGGIGVLVAPDITLDLQNTGLIEGSSTFGATGVVVLSSLDGSIVNDGTISANAGGSSFASVIGLGIFGSVTSAASITNSGTISGSASGTLGAAARGFVAGAMLGTLTNDGDITAKATAASGAMVAGLFVSSLGGSATNNGTISGSATSDTGSARGWGLYVQGPVSGSLTNSEDATISATATGANASATGAVVFGSLESTSNFSNAGTISADANASSAWAEGYGVRVFGSMAGTFDNSGSITASATSTNTSGTASWASAVGVAAEGGLTGSFDNSGTISANATADSWAGAFGVDIGGSLIGASFENSSADSISATASGAWADATAVYIDGSLDSTSSFTNSGSISAKANASSNWAEGYGVHINGSVAGAFDNSGSISASASSTNTSGTASSASAVGVIFEGGLSGTFDNSGTISANAIADDNADALGVGINGSLTGASFTNSSPESISATATGSSAWAWAVAINGSLDSTSSFTNSGSISAEANASSNWAEGYGVAINGSVAGSFDNSGSISASASSTSLFGNASSASAIGVVFEGGLSGTFDNTGTISANATADDWAGAIGVYINGDMTGASFSNSSPESISATATGSSANATAVWIDGSLDSMSSFTNDGSISATATATSSDAYAAGVYIDGDMNGTFINTGSISAIADAEDSVTASAVYMGALGSGASVSNTGTIEASAFSEEDEAYAYALQVGSLTNANLYNSASGSISANATGSSAEATAVDISGSIDSMSSFVNRGSISAIANATDDEDADAMGVEADGMNGTFINSGSITAEANNTFTYSATASAVDIGSLGTGASVTNSGSITAQAHADDYWAEAIAVDMDSLTEASFTNEDTGEIFAWAEGTSVSATGLEVSYVDSLSTVTNHGIIGAFADASENYAEAEGIDTDGGLDGDLENTGTILALARTNGEDGTAEATGIDVDGTLGAEGSVTNSGFIQVGATGIPESYNAEAVGIEVGGEGSAGGAIDNSGLVEVNAKSAGYVTATGIHTYGLGTDSSITNSGNIDVSAVTQGYMDDDDGNDAFAAGIHAYWMNDATITNTLTGDIDVEAVGVGFVGASGIHAGYYVDSMSSVSNEGSIDVSASQAGTGMYSGAAAVGITAYDVAGSISNSGSINVSATASGEAFAAGILIPATTDDTLLSGGSVSNSGSIDVSASSGGFGEAAGIYIGHMESDTSVTNSAGGSIFASLSAVGSTATSDPVTPMVAGIWIGSMDSMSTLTNHGTVSASGSGTNVRHWSIYVEDGGGNTIINTGRIGSQMNIDNADVINTGTVAVPAGQVSLITDGDYTQSGSGRLEIGVNGSSVGEYGSLQVLGGVADISDNGNFAVDIAADPNLSDGDVLHSVLGTVGTTGARLITADNLNVTETVESLLWDFTAIVDPIRPYHIDLLVERDLLVVETIIDNSPVWALPVAEEIEDIIQAGPTGDMRTVLLEMKDLEGDDLSAAVAQFVPVLVAQSSKAASLMASDMTNAISARMQNRGVGAGEAGYEKNAWVRLFGSRSKQKDKDDAPGWESDNFGFVIGLDSEAGEDWNFGAALGYQRPQTDSDNRYIDHEVDTQGWQVAMYGDWSNDDDLYAELIGMAGFNQNKSKRHISFEGIDRTAKGEYDSWYARLYTSVGKSYTMNETFMLSPEVHLGYTYVKEDNYRESGADSMNLIVDGNSAKSLIFGASGKGTWLIGSNGSMLTGLLTAGYDPMTQDATLVAKLEGGGSSFRTVSDEADNWLIRAGIGADIVASDRVDLEFLYSYEYRGDFSNQILTATLRWMF